MRSGGICWSESRRISAGDVLNSSNQNHTLFTFTCRLEATCKLFHASISHHLTGVMDERIMGAVSHDKRRVSTQTAEYER